MGFDDIHHLSMSGHLHHESDMASAATKAGNLKGIRRDSTWCACSGDWFVAAVGSELSGTGFSRLD
jgi:hypothetical protein